MPRTLNDHFGKRFSRPLWAIALSLAFSLTISAQEQAFDYHLEETPAVSWNRLPLFDARAMAAGGVSLLASPAFAAAFNPALIPDGRSAPGSRFRRTALPGLSILGRQPGSDPRAIPFDRRCTPAGEPGRDPEPGEMAPGGRLLSFRSAALSGFCPEAHL